MTSPGRNDRDRPPTASRVIADDLRQQINTGVLAPGDQLPSERSLATQFGAARNTAREAVRLLAEEGLVTAEHGRGVFVRAPARLIRLGNDRYSRKYRESGTSPFLLECARQGKSGRFDVLSIDEGPASADVALRLGLPPAATEVGPQVVRRHNVFYADDDPVYLVTTYVLAATAEGTDLLVPVIQHPYGVHGVFEEQGHVMARLHEEVSARMPDPDERQHLQLPPGVPVLDVLHTSIDTHGIPYEVTRFVMRSDMSGLLYDVPVE